MPLYLPFFGGRRVVDVTSDMLARYVDSRQGAVHKTLRCSACPHFPICVKIASDRDSSKIVNTQNWPSTVRSCGSGRCWKWVAPMVGERAN